MICDVLVCEEITQMEVQPWADICKLALGGVSFILCGDFSQFPACCESHVGCPDPEGVLEQSHMVRGCLVATASHSARINEATRSSSTSTPACPRVP